MPFNRIQSAEQFDNHIIYEDEIPKRSAMHSFEYVDKKPASKKRFTTLANRLNDATKNSNYSSSSRYTSFLKGSSISQCFLGNQVSQPQIALFKQSQSAYYNQLKEKYLERDAPLQKIKEEMMLALERKVSQLQALRIHRDELKFISNNNPYSNPIKIGFTVLKQKAKAEEKVRNAIDQLNKDIKDIDEEFITMTEYFNFLKSSLTSTGDEDLIIDTQEEQKLMIQNLTNQNNHLFRLLKESDKKNAKQIKDMQVSIGNLRVSIKQKQDKIRDLKSKICTMYIKLHSRNSSSKQKNFSLSIKKFNTQQHSKLQQAFIGNKNFKNYSKEIIQKVNDQEQLLKIVFYCQGLKKKEIVAFKCIYKSFQGKMHKNPTAEEESANNAIIPKIHSSKQIQKAYQNATFQSQKNITSLLSEEVQINPRNLLSMKFFFKSKIVGVQCRIKTDKGNKHVIIGDCQPTIQHELLTMVNKKIVTLGSFWHHREMIGIGVWYSSTKAGISPRNSFSGRSSQKASLNRVKSDKAIQSKKNIYTNSNDYSNEYYAN